MKNKLNLLLIMITMLMTACSNSIDTAPDEVSLDEMLGQMLLVGFRGYEATADSQIVKDIIAKKVGGVILFDRDAALGINQRNIQSPQQVKALIATLQSYAATPLLVSVDQEGGKVCRLKTSYGFSPNVSQQYLGTLNNPDSTHYYAALTATELAEAGFNLNFAPVVDLNVNPECPVIGAMERSFSADPQVVTDNAIIVIDEHHAKNVFCTLKHFPGHGSATADSHQGLVDVTNTWTSAELKPYQNLIAAGKVDAIMTAHIFNGNMDANYPATLSKGIISGVLRTMLGFDGVVVSDDMNMKAITEYYGFEEALELAVNAGVDMLCLANNLTYDVNIATRAHDTLKKLVAEGKISRSRVEEAYKRIMKLKAKLGLTS